MSLKPTASNRSSEPCNLGFRISDLRFQVPAVAELIRNSKSEFRNSAMVVGSLSVRLLVREARSLKDKRQVVRSILDRVRHEFNVSAAEVDDLDEVRTVRLGFAMVGWDAKHVREALQQIAEALRRHPIAEFLECQLETS